MRKNPLILVAEDNTLIRSALVFVIQKEGYDVLSAKHGAEALKIFHAHEIDLVLTDIMMPELDGVELAESIKNTHPQLPIIALTGGNFLEENNGEYIPFDDVLSKPALYEQILMVINRFLKASHGRATAHQ
jgi:two-component system cell cycle response regulator CpdR